MLTVEEAAALLGVAPRTMYSLAAPAGPLPSYRIGRSLRFEQTDVVEYKEQCRCVPAQRVRAPPLRTFTIRASSIDGSELRETFRKLGVKPKYNRGR
jgi:excisionase family DNA binding protein